MHDAALGGKRQAVLCSDVQKEVFPELAEGDIQPTNETGRNSAPNSQELGMIKAKQREDTRRAARLIYHFGFQHFAPDSQEVNTNNGTLVSPATSSDRKKGNRAIGVEQQDAKVEAVQNGKVIQDVTRAKGEWGLRYKRD